MFYVNNYINWDKFNQIYDLDQIKKFIENIDAVAYKLRLALIKATNHKLEITR